jgi:ABC-type nitrate/sulfonate/bicarbonate transport system substrate-binding protein
MAENAAALRAGEVDVIQVFEPYAQALVDEGAGHVWYAAASRGPTSYTSLNTTRAYIEREPETVLRLTRAMYRTLKWIAARNGHALAEAIAGYFPDIAVARSPLAATVTGRTGLEPHAHPPAGRPGVAARRHARRRRDRQLLRL